MQKQTVGSVIAIAWALSVPHIAHAQSLPQAGGDEIYQAARSATGLQDIIVTAQKRAEPLQEVPIAVSAFESAALESANIDAITGLRGLVPGMTVSRSGAGLGTVQISMRGISLQDVARSSESGIGFTIDGIPLAYQRGALLDSFDIERLEILRGPQGLLFGKNTTGGTINVIRSRPDPEGDVTGKVRVTVGSFGRRDFEGVVSAPVIPGLLAAKAAISVKKNNGEYRNIVFGGREGDRDMRDYIVALVATPSDRTSFYLSYERLEDDSNIPPYMPLLTSAVVPLPAPKLLDPAAPGYQGGANLPCINPATSVVCVPLRRSRNGVETPPGEPSFWNLDAITFEATHELDNMRLVSLTGYRADRENQTSHFDATRFALFQLVKPERSKQFSQELRAETNFDGPLNIVAGAFYLTYSYTARQFVSADVAALNPAVPPGTSYLNSLNSFRTHQSNRSVALFFQADYEITERLSATVGARQTWDKREMDYTLWGPVADTVRRDTILGALVGDVSNEVKFKKFTPKIGFQYELADDVRIHGSYSRGYNTGGFNGRAGGLIAAITPYKPETMDAFEVGFKSEFLDNRVRLNLAGFRNTLKDKQEDVLRIFTDSTGQLQNVTTTVNAAKARYQGIEAELAVVPVPGWTISSSAGYLDAKYLDYVADLGQGLADLTDLKLRRAPKWTAGMISDYIFQAGAGEVGLNAALYHTSSYETNVLNDPRGRIPPVTKLDLGIRYSFPVRSTLELEVAGFVKNVTDNTTYDGMISGNRTGTFLEFAIPTVGRTWGMSLAARF